jgi:hypothetical protein
MTIAQLQKLIQEVYSKYTSAYWLDRKRRFQETFCNFAVNDVVYKVGYKAFWKLNANQIVEKMENGSDNWQQLYDEETAFNYVNQGNIVLAGLKGDKHGHVNVLYPSDKLEWSGKWSQFVPKCMNIGKTDFIDKGINYAFGSNPEYWALKL